MTKEEFLAFHSSYFGEPVDNVKQIVNTCFTGEELFEYLDALTTAVYAERDASHELNQELLSKLEEVLREPHNVRPAQTAHHVAKTHRVTPSVQKAADWYADILRVVEKAKGGQP